MCVCICIDKLQMGNWLLLLLLHLAGAGSGVWSWRAMGFSGSWAFPTLHLGHLGVSPRHCSSPIASSDFPEPAGAQITAPQ